MNRKKVKKLITTGLLTLTFSGAVVPSVMSNISYASENIVSVYKKEQIVNKIENYDFVFKYKLSIDKQNYYKNILKQVLPNYNIENYEVVFNLIDKFIAEDNGYFYIEDRASFWDGQGITTDELGSVIDSFIILLSGGSFGGAKVALNSIIRRFGMEGAINFIRNKLIGMGLGGIAHFVRDALPVIVHLTSPGKGLAEWIDSWDFHPHNGRINAWR